MNIRRTIVLTFLLATISILRDTALAEDIEHRDRPVSGFVGRFQTQEWSSAAALSPNGKVIAVAGQDIALFELETGKRIGRFEEPETLLLAYLDEGKTLASVGLKGNVRYWSLENNTEVQPAWQAFVPDQTDWEEVIAGLSPDGRFLLAPSEGYFNVWDLKRRTRVHRFKEPPDHDEFALSPDGNSIATYSADRGLVILDAATGKQRARVDFPGYHFAIRYSPDGKMLVTCGGHDRYRVWDAATLREICNFAQRDRGHSRVMRFSPDSRLLATTHGDLQLRVWDLQTKQELCKCNLGHENRMSILQWLFFTPDRRRLITVAEGKAVVRVWDATTGEETNDAPPPQPRR